MKSYSALRTQVGRLTKNTNSTHLTEMDELINDDHRTVNAIKDWSWLHRTRTDTTTANGATYSFPHDLDQLEDLYVTVSSRRYTPRIIHSRQDWNFITQSSVTSDIPEYVYVLNGQIELYPTPATAANVITFTGKVRVPDLNIADYTTGTVDIITNGSKTVTGASTVWTSPMVGRWLRVTHSNVVASSGDGTWYEIASRASDTSISLVREYGGTTLGTPAGAAYAIGQMPLLPEFAHDMPAFYASGIYWYNNDNSVKGDKYMAIRDRKMHILETQFDSETTDVVLDDGDGRTVENPNLFVSL